MAGLVVWTVFVVVCFADQTTTLYLSPRTTPDIPLVVFHVESTTSAIKINWTSNYTLSNFQVQARSTISGILLFAHPTNHTEFTMTELMVDTPYEICVTADVIEHEPLLKQNGGKIRACLESRTIPFLRLDSVLILFGVVGFVLLSIFAALICWKCAQNEEAEMTDRTASDDYKENGLECGDPEHEIGKNPDEAAHPLLAAEETDKINSQPSSDSPPNNVQSNELPGVAADHSTLV